MQQWLAATRYCDWQAPPVWALARRLAWRLADPWRRARVIWLYVRDEIPYRFDYWHLRASDTLRRGGGMCTNKANLQVALLRASGIPAAFGHYLIHKEALRPVTPPALFARIGEPTTHFFCLARLEGRWVAMDATVDRPLALSAYRGLPGWRPVPWWGQHLAYHPRYVVRNLGPVANPDPYLQVPPRLLNDHLLAEANRYLARLRAAARERSTP